jgi:tetratricopeptide (TPR) repeat protein
MEFLDDLIKNQDTDKQPKPTEEPESDAWGDLLNDLSYEDLFENDVMQQNDKRSRKSSRRRTSTKRNPRRRRKSILTLLVVSIFLIWGIIFALILRSSDITSFLGISAKPQPIKATPDSQELDTSLAPSQDNEDTPTASTQEEDTGPEEETITEPKEIPTPPSLPDAPFTRFDREIQEKPELLDLYLLRGQEYLDKGAFEAALADFEYVLAIDDSRAEAYAGLGRVFYHLRRWNQAERALNTAIDFNEELSDAYFWLGHIYFNKGEYKAAFYAYDMAAEYDRGDAAAEAWLAFTSFELGDYYETLGAVTRAMSITHDLAIVYVASSSEHLLRDPPDIDGAQGDLLYARELEPNDFVTLNALANFYINYRPERLAEAELLAHYAQNWAQNDIEKAIAFHTLGRVYLEKGLKADAETVLIQSMDLATVDGFVILPRVADDFNRSRE